MKVDQALKMKPRESQEHIAMVMVCEKQERVRGEKKEGKKLGQQSEMKKKKAERRAQREEMDAGEGGRQREGEEV